MPYLLQEDMPYKEMVKEFPILGTVQDSETLRYDYRYSGTWDSFSFYMHRYESLLIAIDQMDGRVVAGLYYKRKTKDALTIDIACTVPDMMGNGIMKAMYVHIMEKFDCLVYSNHVHTPLAKAFWESFIYRGRDFGVIVYALWGESMKSYKLIDSKNKGIWGNNGKMCRLVLTPENIAV